ncbi:MAG: hypothetical protein AB1810_07270 [Pseudomonadota bacterium]
MSRLLKIAVSSLLLWLPGTGVTQEHGGFVYRAGVVEDDLYLAGGRVQVNAEVTGDVLAAGGHVLVENQVSGDVMAAGGAVEIRGQIADDVRAVGGQVQLRGVVGGDAVVAAGDVVLARGARVAGRAWLNGGEVEVAGQVDRELRINGGTVVIAGEVAGDAIVTARTLKLLPQAVIRGALHYRGPQAAEIDPQAKVVGDIRYEPLRRHEMPEFSFAWAIVLLFGLTLALWLPGVAAYLAFGDCLLHTARTIGERPGVAFGLGLAIAFATPPLSVLLLASGIGAVLGLALLLCYALSMIAAWIVGVFFLSDAVLRRWSSGKQQRKSWQLLYNFSAVIAVCLVAMIPLLGQLALLGLIILGIGAIYYQVYRNFLVGTKSTGLV